MAKLPKISKLTNNFSNADNLYNDQDCCWKGAESIEILDSREPTDIIDLGPNTDDGGEVIENILERLSEVFKQRINNEVMEYDYHVQNLLNAIATHRRCGGANNDMMDIQNETAHVLTDIGIVNAGHGDCIAQSAMLIEDQKLKYILKCLVLASSISRSLLTLRSAELN